MEQVHLETPRFGQHWRNENYMSSGISQSFPHFCEYLLLVYFVSIPTLLQDSDLVCEGSFTIGDWIRESSRKHSFCETKTHSLFLQIYPLEIGYRIEG